MDTSQAADCCHIYAKDRPCRHAPCVPCLPRLKLGGRETEELAMRDCIELHERHPQGSPIASGQWEGGKLVSC